MATTILSSLKRIWQRISNGRAASIVKERLIDFSTLDSASKGAVCVCYAMIAATAVLIPLHSRLANTDIVHAVIFQIPVGVLIASIPLFMLALTFLLTGALLAGRKLRYWTVGLVAVYLLFVAESARFSFIRLPDTAPELHGRPSVIVFVAMLEPAALLLLVTALFVRRLRPLWVTALCPGLVVLLFSLASFIAHRWNPTFGWDLMIFTYMWFLVLATAALVVVGFDLVEWALLLGGFFGDALHSKRRNSMVVLIALSIAFNLGLAGFNLWGSNGRLIAIRAIIFTALLVCLIGVFAFRGAPPHETYVRRFPLLGFGLLTLVGVMLTESQMRKDAPPPVYNYHGRDGAREFTVTLPSGWEPNLAEDRREGVMLTVTARNHAFMAIHGFEGSLGEFELLNQMIPGGNQFPLTKLKFESGNDDGWDRFDTTLRNAKSGSDIHFIVWHSTLSSTQYWLNTEWYILGACRTEVAGKVMSQFDEIRKSFYINSNTIASPPGVIFYSFWGLLAGTGILLLLVCHRSPRRPAFALLFTVSGFVIASYVLCVSPSIKHHGINDQVSRTEIFHCAQLVIAALSAVFLWLLRIRLRDAEFRDRALHLILGLNLSLLVANAFLTTYQFGSLASEWNSFGKAIVVLLALTFEIVMSGAITNRSSRWFSRNGRIMLFLSYMLLIVFATFCFFHIRAKYLRMTDFDAEEVVQIGILMLGIPFLLVVFSSRAAELIRQRRPDAGAET